MPDRLPQLLLEAGYCELDKEKKNETISKHSKNIRYLTVIKRQEKFFLNTVCL
jgi:hypothetical protein